MQLQKNASSWDHNQEGTGYNNFMIKLQRLTNNINDINDTEYPYVVNIEDKLTQERVKISNDVSQKILSSTTTRKKFMYTGRLQWNP